MPPAMQSICFAPHCSGQWLVSEFLFNQLEADVALENGSLQVGYFDLLDHSEVCDLLLFEGRCLVLKTPLVIAALQFLHEIVSNTSVFFIMAIRFDD